MKRKRLVTVVVAILLVCVLLVVTAPSRVEGQWRANVGYLKKYGCDAVNTYFFYGDGTYQSFTSNAHTGEILKAEEGPWDMRLFSVSAYEAGKKGAYPYTPFTYNPILGSLNNGGGLIPFDGDVIFHKVG